MKPVCESLVVVVTQPVSWLSGCGFKSQSLRHHTCYQIGEAALSSCSIMQSASVHTSRQLCAQYSDLGLQTFGEPPPGLTRSHQALRVAAQ